MNGCKRVSTLGMSREAWLEHRRKSIGGSDAAAIIGLSSYATPYTVWADKTGRLPASEDTEAARQGRDLEEYVARRWRESTGKRAERVNAILYNPQYPFAHADVDRRVVGENAGLECKTTSSLNLRKFKGVEFPEQYYVQCVHYLAVTGADRWYLAVLVLGREFLVYTLERDQAEIDALMEAESQFWELVQEDCPPEMDGGEATSSALGKIYADGGEAAVDLFGREAMLEEYRYLLAQKRGLELRVQQIRQTLMQDLGEAEEGACGPFRVTWKRQKRAFISPKKLLAVYPKLDLSKVVSVSKYRRFQIQEERANAVNQNLPGSGADQE